MWSCMIELMPHIIFSLSFGSVFVKGHDINNCLRVLLLISFGNPIVAQHSLPFLGKPLREVRYNAQNIQISHTKRD